ncbi:MAG: hypothetical protein GC189_12435 [Alphaproteobacteria bacterium]|nr:hypothetical protein [Alphaproteobacteria bacterium]
MADALKMLFNIVFGAKPAPRRINAPPRGVRMRRVRARNAQPVSARLANTNGAITSGDDALAYRAGEHYIVHYADGGEAPVARKIFERTYVRRSDGLYEKRTDIVFRYFTLPHAVIVNTLEGAKRANPGDWIMQGVLGEIYPIPAREADRKYEAA